jgi:hypothetical protein
VTGDREFFLREVRALLNMPKPKNPNFDPIRIRTGGTIEIEGHYTSTIKSWLAGLGF